MTEKLTRPHSYAEVGFMPWLALGAGLALVLPARLESF
jgi:hypothetical protein